MLTRYLRTFLQSLRTSLEVRKIFYIVCNKAILTSETIRSTNLLNVLIRNIIDKGVQKLGGCLSELPGGKSKRSLKNRNVSD